MNEKKRNIWKAAIYIGLTALVGVTFLYVGVPALARLAIFLGESSKVSQEQDEIAPAPPRLAPHAEFVNKDTVDIKGFTEAEAEVVLTLNSVESGRVLADNSGEFLFAGIAISEGENEIFVVAVDQDNNTSQPSGILKITLDKEVPEIAVQNIKDGETITGSDKKDFKIVGKTEEGATVKVNSRNALVDGEEFEITLTLAEGEQDIVIEALDRAGNKQEKTFTVTYRP